MTAHLVLCALLASAAGPLPKPDTSGGKPLMQALKERKSSREFRAENLSPQTLSNLLWAAFGVNRPDGRRTAATARNVQDIDIYVFTSSGVYLYKAKEHALELVAEGDHRAATGNQEWVKTAPLNLVLVSDQSKLSKTPEPERLIWAGIHAGAITQNVYLYCASEGLGSVVRATMNREEISKVLKLRPDQRIIIAQTVGLPK